jgi:Tfp pilus assembly pilus retraction ATPase PilT
MAKEFALSLITQKELEILEKDQNYDFSFGYEGRRFRANISYQLGNYMTVLRLLTLNIPDIDDL